MLCRILGMAISVRIKRRYRWRWRGQMLQFYNQMRGTILLRVYGKALSQVASTQNCRSDVSPLLHSAPRSSENGSKYQKPVVDTPIISRPPYQWGTFPTTQATGRPCQVCREVPSTANKDQDILSCVPPGQICNALCNRDDWIYHSLLQCCRMCEVGL